METPLIVPCFASLDTLSLLVLLGSNIDIILLMICMNGNGVTEAKCTEQVRDGARFRASIC